MTRRPRGARALIGLALAAVLALVLAAPAAAHPLGNFSVNHVTEVRVDRDGVVARYLLDRAEIPTFQSRGTPAPALLAQVRGEVARGLELTVDGRRVALRPTAGARIEFQPGQGGLRTTRVTLPLRADVRDPRGVAVRDRTYGDRAGWVAVVPKPGTGTAVDSSVPADDPTDGLRTYPSDALRSPVDERAATLTVAAGDGTVTAPRRDGSGTETEGGQRADDGFADLLADAVSGKTALVLLLLAAFGWGALHALSPGHGKAMVAAYLVGARGTVKHAVALGGVVTFTHTIGVFALGAVTLALSAYVLPEQLYPWLTLVSGVLVLAVGAGVLRSRLRVRRAMAAGDGAVTLHGQEHAHDHGHTHAHSHDHGHSHSHDQGHSHTHDHGHSHTLVHSHGGGKPHSHEIPTDITWKGLVGLGASAGLIPCPSALVVLLGAISQHAVGLGLVLIVAFSLGLAATLVALGIAVVQARRLTTRVRIPRRFATAAPALSAGLIVAVGLVLTIQAMPKVL